MKKSDANHIIGLINEFPKDKIEVSQGMQSAVNAFIESYIKQNKDWNLSTIKWEFDKKSNCLTKAFQQAVRNKTKEIGLKILDKRKVVELPKETEYLIKEASEKLNGMSVQNINKILKKYKLPVREESARKRYVTDSTIEKIRTGNYN
jgi:hypothetical protein